jgi:hypothetical protein
MFGIFMSALGAMLGFLLRSVLVKFFAFFALFFITTEFISILSSFLPDTNSFSNALSGIPSGVWYFLDLFNVSSGIPLLLSAWATRFIIRRLPVIG